MTHFTIEDLNLIGEFIDIATKSHGYTVAEKAFPIVQKMRMMAAEMTPAPALEPMPVDEPPVPADYT